MSSPAHQKLGITRDKFNHFLKAKGKKIIAKKRFSKNSLRKTCTPIPTQMMRKIWSSPRCLIIRPEPAKLK